MDRPPNARDVDRFHTHADTDRDNRALHHTLGVLPSQASPGHHNHDGNNSRKIRLDELVIVLDDVEYPYFSPLYPIDLAAGFETAPSSQQPGVYRAGYMLYFQGRVRRTAGAWTGSLTIGTLPDEPGFRVPYGASFVTGASLITNGGQVAYATVSGSGRTISIAPYTSGNDWMLKGLSGLRIGS